MRPRGEFQTYRLSLLVAFIIICALILILRLAYLQFSEYKRFSTLSQKNQISMTPLSPSRGIIYDTNGVVLADNSPVYVLEIIPERIQNLTDTLKRLQKILPSITNEEVEQFHRLRKQNRSYLPIPLKLKLTPEEVATFAGHQYEFTGVHMNAQLLRYYPYQDITAHVLGYVGRINLEELKQLDATAYRATNFIGKSGIERYYEPILHGQVGYQHAETDVSGRTLRILKKEAPISGQNLYLTLDIRLQKKAYEAMEGKQGAVILMKAQGGDVLAMVSAPSYDPNQFVKGIQPKAYQALLLAKERPLYNRAIRGLYPPASPVKPFLALAGLDRGIVTPSTSIYDPGYYHLPGVKHAYRDWKRGGHGFMNLKRAITVSCDTYFYHLGNKMGIDGIQEMLSQFGLGRLSHIDLKEEAAGLMPNPPWKRQTKGLPWYPGDTLISSIGQGFMLVSPLQLANAVASMSQKGRRYQPHLMNYAIDEHHDRHDFMPIEEYPVQLKKSEHWDLVIEAMQQVIMSPEGTAGYRFGRNAPYTVAGKTGTAQVFSISQDEKKRNLAVPAELRDHSLFIAFAPVDNPEVAITVIVEHDTTAVQVARQVLDAYFSFYHSTDLKDAA